VSCKNEQKKELKSFKPVEEELIDPLRQGKVIHFVEGLDICVEDSLVRFIHQSPGISESIYIFPSNGKVKISTKFKDTTLKKDFFSLFCNSIEISLFNNFKYSIKNNIVHCTSDSKEFVFNSSAWSPKDHNFESVKLDEIEIGKEYLVYGSDFFTIHKIVNLKSKNKNLDFLKSSYILVDCYNKLDKSTKSKTIYKNVILELYNEKPRSVNEHKYDGLIVK
jgi:hypothetical protein